MRWHTAHCVGCLHCLRCLRCLRYLLLSFHPSLAVRVFREDRVTELVGLCIAFALRGSVLAPALGQSKSGAPPGESTLLFKTWSKLRKHVKKLLLEYHADVRKKADPDPDLDSDDVDAMQEEPEVASGPLGDLLAIFADENNQKTVTKLLAFVGPQVVTV